MRKYFAVMLSGLFLTMGAAAEMNTGGKEGKGQMSEEQCAAMRSSMVDKKLGMLTENLTLTSAQQGEVKTILTEEIANKCPHGGQSAGKTDPNMGAMKARVRAVLTPEQQAKFDTMGAGKSDKMAGQKKGGKGEACCPH